MGEVVRHLRVAVTAELILALDDRFGEPVDAYVNGAQVWLRDDGPGGAGLEWRLHPVAGFRQPAGLDPSRPVRRGGVRPAHRRRARPPRSTSCGRASRRSPATATRWSRPRWRRPSPRAIGIAPDAFGVVDHDRIGDEWERSGGQTSIVQALAAQLGR